MIIFVCFFRFYFARLRQHLLIAFLGLLKARTEKSHHRTKDRETESEREGQTILWCASFAKPFLKCYFIVLRVCGFLFISQFTFRIFMNSPVNVFSPSFEWKKTGDDEKTKAFLRLHFSIPHTNKKRSSIRLIRRSKRRRNFLTSLCVHLKSNII